MDRELLEIKYRLLLDKVRRMRGVQKEYFRYRCSEDLKRARRLEREVDQIIQEEVKIKQSGIQELF